MNFIFFSPHFPDYCTEFCVRLARAGVRVMGIGDAPSDRLRKDLYSALTDYYRVDSLEDVDAVIRAVGYFTFRYGKIDRFESLNEHWLELEARVRTEFNIYGTKLDFIANLKQKSRMREFFRKSGVPTVRQYKGADREAALKFIKEVGYPVVAKPDMGSGASMTRKITTREELDRFFQEKPENVPFVWEEFVDGVIVTYDGLVDRDGQVVFSNSHLFEQSIMEVVNRRSHLYYFCLPKVEVDVEEAGRAVLKALDVRERFFHIELFRRRCNGQLVALEINMRPPGAWMTDAINYAHDMDIYQQWAALVAQGRVEGAFPGKYVAGYASRKDHLSYRYAHQEILRVWDGKVLRHAPVEPVFRGAMGDYAYQFRTKTLAEAREVAAFIQEEYEDR